MWFAVRYTRLAPPAAPAAPAAGDRSILTIDLSNAGLVFAMGKQEIQGIEATFITIGGDDALEGHLLTPPPAGTSPSNFSGVTLFFSVQFGVGQQADGFWPASLGTTTISLDAAAIRAAGGSVGAVVTTARDTPAEVRVGFSLVSTAMARANVAKVARLSFDEVAAASWRTWDATLARISIEDDASAPAAASGRNLFYSVLFHALRKPTDFTEQVPRSWTGTGGKGYIFDLGTMWDQ